MAEFSRAYPADWKLAGPTGDGDNWKLLGYARDSAASDDLNVEPWVVVTIRCQSSQVATSSKRISREEVVARELLRLAVLRSLELYDGQAEGR